MNPVSCAFLASFALAVRQHKHAGHPHTATLEHFLKTTANACLVFFHTPSVVYVRSVNRTSIALETRMFPTAHITALPLQVPHQSRTARASTEIGEGVYSATITNTSTPVEARVSSITPMRAHHVHQMWCVSMRLWSTALTIATVLPRVQIHMIAFV